MQARLDAEQYLDAALNALNDDADWRAVLDRLPVPVYLTDADGSVTYWNQACVAFAGREPRLGHDRWCVTWRLYTTCGDDLPHEQCPMAEAIRKKREVRGKVAIAMRPDGSRLAFTPYPTPLFAEDGSLKGAVNMLIDVSDEQAGALAEQAARCRRLSLATHDRDASHVLGAMAHGYEQIVQALRPSAEA